MRGIMAAAVLAAGMLALGTAASSAETATANDTARFLAGLPPATDTSLATLAASAFWKQHARYFDSIFAREESANLSKIRVFSQTQLAEKHDTLLYMFSGPDFLYATSFFPTASTYVLSGLEPVGDIPPLTGLKRAVVEQTLRNLETSLSSIFSFSFFITRNMKTQLRAGPVYGTLPILYVFLARTGKTVKDVSFVALDPLGNVETVGEPGAKNANRRAAASAAKGVKIVFADGDHPDQTLYYFSTDLADDSVRRSGFLAFCAKLGIADSFLKSASYLLYSDRFAKVRSFLLDHSATILQDDSGIPLVYFDQKKWRLQPFGRYIGPISVFEGTYQPLLSQLFHRGNAIPIDFGVGYRWRRNESNLLLAEKTATGPTTDLTSHLPTDRYRRRAEHRSPHTAKAATTSSRPRRKHVEDTSRRWFGCPMSTLFPFCSAR